MKDTCKIVFGLALIVAGMLWMLNILGVFMFHFSTVGWWTLFIIIPSIFGLINDTDKIGPAFGIIIGVLLLLATRGVITWDMMWKLALALFIIAFGIKVLLGKPQPESCCEAETILREGKEVRKVETSFGKQEISFAGEKFEGADVKTSFGATTLDLRKAIIENDAFINLDAGFGGVVILIPDGLAVKTSASCGFGGINDKRSNKVTAGSPVLFITGKIGFAGVEIR